ncbi:Triglyceride lipase [Novymonas esmeraldas]|uniref:Triglyceride lipase n=1 Tax=Novymonas esmeraldas TaxID=1808958 RepID=A0AAW0EUJ7_9TRYP
MPTAAAAAAPSLPVSAVPQPQWPQFAQMRSFFYTHTQPQWSAVRPSTADAAGGSGASGVPATRRRRLVADTEWGIVGGGSDAWTPITVRPPPLHGRRVCTACRRLKESCTCTSCTVCRNRFRGNRHHCRRCWHAVCTACWGHQHYVHMLGHQMSVCDRCSTPSALANLSTRGARGLRWGLYVLQAAGAMPRLCILPSCATLTRQLMCYACGMPTVVTQPHVPRVVRFSGGRGTAIDAVNALDARDREGRALEVDGTTTAQAESLFRSVFPRYEEVLAFRAVAAAVVAQKVLLAMVASAIAYEYQSSPSTTLRLSDIPYARLLRVSVATERFTILEAPGRVKFIALPGTHNWRTRWVDVQFAHATEEVWSALHDGVRLTDESGDGAAASVFLHGGVRKMWEYHVHKGIAREALAVGLPMDSLLEDVRSGGYTLVLCGHSLGGAVAQHLSLQLLHRSAALLVPRHRPQEADTARLLCVTLGAPLLGNYRLADHVHSCGWAHLFHNFVYCSDVVPRLSCSDELAWDTIARLTNFFSTVFRAAHTWWRRGGDNSGTPPPPPLPPPPPRAAAAAAAAVPTTAAGTPVSASTPSRLGALSAMLSRSRAGEQPPTAAAGRVGATDECGDAVAADSPLSWAEQARLAAFVDTTIRYAADALEDDEDDDDSQRSSRAAVAQLDADVETVLHRCRVRVECNDAAPADVVVPTATRRLHRRFTCFGRYHFVEYGAYGYVTTTDSETAFGILKHGCGAASHISDHSVEAYNRGILTHLHRRHET